jgi:hypothetical protein
MIQVHEAPRGSVVIHVHAYPLLATSDVQYT